MKLLIAEDDVLFQKMLTQVLAPDYEVIVASNGDEAWEILQQADAPRLAILDWVMPGLTGPEICRKVRACPSLSSMYLLIVTSKNSESDIVAGLRAGADDYITKPPITAELRARVRVGERVLSLQATVAAHEALRKEVVESDLFIDESMANKEPIRESSAVLKPYSILAYETPEHRTISRIESGYFSELAIHTMERSHPKR